MFHHALLKGAARTYATRKVEKEYGVVAKWLRIGLDTAINGTGWFILSSARQCAVTDRNVLKQYFTQGYPQMAQPKDQPYQIAHTHTLHPETWANYVHWFADDPDYLSKTETFIRTRKKLATRMDRSHAKHAKRSAPSDDESSSSSSSYSTSHSSRSHGRGQWQSRRR